MPLPGALARSPIPIAAAITGHATAGGTVLLHLLRLQDCGHRAIGSWDSTRCRLGCPCRRCIFSGLERLIGAHQAERLAVGGLLISPDEALRESDWWTRLFLRDQVVSRALDFGAAACWHCRWMRWPLRGGALALTYSNYSRSLSISSSTMSTQLGGVLRGADHALGVLVDRLARKKV